jgi:ABC-type branched-subunit amino acid transport system substrate-binding protein
MGRRTFGVAAAFFGVAFATAPAPAQTVKIGLINSYSGFVAQVSDQAQKGIDLYIKLHAI